MREEKVKNNHSNKKTHVDSFVNKAQLATRARSIFEIESVKGKSFSGFISFRLSYPLQMLVTIMTSKLQPLSALWVETRK